MNTVIVDTGALISLGHVRQIELIGEIFDNFYIANAVWEELLKYENPHFDKSNLFLVENRVVKIKSINHLSVIMDYGESESVILYEELNANYLLIDDHKARSIAESFNVNCIGSIGILLKAKQLELINDLRPIFQSWLDNKRYFSGNLLNQILIQVGEKPL